MVSQFLGALLYGKMVQILDNYTKHLWYPQFLGFYSYIKILKIWPPEKFLYP